MRLWSRLRPCRRVMLCLWLLILVLSVATLALMDLVFRDQTQTPPNSPRRPFQRLSRPPDLEVIVDSWDRLKQEHNLGLAPLSSLQEDQLLLVPSTQVRNPAPPPRKGSYRMVISSAKKESAVPVLPTHGDMGRPVRLKLEGLERDMEKSALQKYGFNELVSERISLHRRLPEARHPSCLVERYSESLPSASVVICFHDEAWSTLLRTVHSVLDTAPKEYLREVLLVDDLSQHGHLKSVLSEYVLLLEGVRLVRSTWRLGVAGCRSLGAARAVGEVLVFMDSHCECHRGWLEPLLERVAQDRTRVVSPIIDVIDWQTFQYNATQWPHRGVFDWRLDFNWETLSQQEDQDSPVEPVQSPALEGVVLAIDRHFFQSVGGYDPGMLFWGAEHMELSIRVWLCGGSMEVVPCSRVAHLGHHHQPYTLPDQDILQRNKIRIADTWLDGFRKIYYKRDTLAHFIRQSESPNITELVRLKKRLGCRNFHWFLTNVYPDLYIPQDRPSLSGELYNVGTGYCADYPGGRGPQGATMDIAPCSGNGYQVTMTMMMTMVMMILETVRADPKSKDHNDAVVVMKTKVLLPCLFSLQHCELNSMGEVRWGPAGRLCFHAQGERVVLTPCPAHQSPRNKPQWRVIKVSEGAKVMHDMTTANFYKINKQKIIVV
uniref:Polypeptide N-acetylgalactosaminyltransferase n=1 Tax=Salmo trutta TaxID=8032 RepID=A0A673ZK47_SALTR